MRRFQHSLTPVDSLAALGNSLASSDWAVEDGEIVFCRSTRQLFEFERRSTAVPNGVDIIAAPVSGGNWKLLADPANAGAFVTFEPTGLADDWPSLNALMAAEAAGLKRPIVFKSGTYACATPGVPANGTVLIMNPEVRVVSTMTYTGAQSHSVFIVGGTFNPTTTTLSTSTVIGSKTVSVVSVSAPPLAAGDRIMLIDGTGLVAQIYDVTNVAGVGPFTLTLDRPVLYAWNSASAVVHKVVTRPENIRIYGNGATITGTGDRGVELTQAKDCLVSYVQFDDSAGSFGEFAGGSFDIGGYRNTWEYCSSVGDTSTTSFGFGHESGEECSIRGCTSRGTTYGLILIDCVNGTIERGTAINCTNGIVYSNSGGVSANRNCSGNDLYAEGCTSGLIDAGTNTRLDHVTAVGCTTGIQTTAGATPCVFDFTGVNNISYDVYAQSQVEIDGFRTVGSQAAFVGAVNTAVPITIEHFDIQMKLSGSGNAINIQGTTGSSHRILNGRIYLPCNNTVAIVLSGAGAVCTAEDIKGTGSGTGTVGFYGNAAGVVRERNVDFSAFATPRQAGTIVYNHGSVQLNGATPVDVAFGDINTGDRVTLTLLTRAGTYGGSPDLSITSGNKFTVTGQASDTSTYSWWIG